MDVWNLSVYCPRMTDLPEAVRNICRERGYECNVSASKGWIFQTVTFSIKGKDLTALRWSLRDTINDYPSMHIVKDERSEPAK